MNIDSTPSGISIDIEPFNLNNVTAALTLSLTMLETAETSILGLGHSLFVERKSADELTKADCIGATLDMINDAKSRIAAVKNGLNAAGGVS